MIHRSNRLLLVVPVVALALTGCSGGSTDTASSAGAASSAAAESPSTGSLDGKSPNEIVDLAQEAMAGASSVHMKGTFTDETSTITIDAVTTAEGDAQAELELAELGTMKVRVVDGTAYVSGEGDYWSMMMGQSGAPEGQWVKGPVDDPRIASVADKVSMSDLLGGAVEADGEFSLVEGKDFDGVPTVGLLDASGDDAAVLYVAAEGAPFPMAVEPKDGSGTITFTEWNAEVTVTAPPASKVTTL